MTQPPPEKPVAPLSIPIFRAFWIAMVFSQIGTNAHDVAIGWLMTEFTDSALVVTSIQIAATLPIFLLGVPAGALADIVDRRLLILRTQMFMFILCLALAGLAHFELLNPVLLLLFTALLAIATALATPGLQATVPDLVPSSSLPNALALGSSSVNIARAVGPAIAAVILGFSAPPFVFLFNGLSFLGIILVLYRWKPKAPLVKLPPESLFGAVRIGFRYTRNSPLFQKVLWRAILFVLPASAMWALLPLFARNHLSTSATTYGILMTMLGFGAILGVVFLPKLRKSLSQQALSLVGTIGLSSGVILLSFCQNWLHAGMVLVGLGVCWLLGMTTLNLAAQTELPSWVRARGLGIHLIVFAGSMALGGMIWGLMAESFGSMMALRISGLGGFLFAMAAILLPLRQPQPDSLAAAHPWPEPPVGRHIALEQGPVLVTVEYRIEEKDREAFLQAIMALKVARLRDGAYRWSLHEQVEQMGVFVESFELESWAEHIRQHERVTKADAQIEKVVDSFHRGESDPVVRHFVGRMPISPR
ncbi:MAG: MFS transporter [Candidatus Sumerlaeia bacterium]|nr:MFS transporter [Candidatus Sumerlaeia bacterium]